MGSFDFAQDDRAIFRSQNGATSDYEFRRSACGKAVLCADAEKFSQALLEAIESATQSSLVILNL